MRKEQDICEAMDLYGDTVWRVCILHFKNQADAEDAFQETFIKYSTHEDKNFETEEYRKAWLIRVASNTCKDILRSKNRHATPIGGDTELSIVEPHDISCDISISEQSAEEIIDAIRGLNDPPRTSVYLSIYEGYSAPEIADILDVPLNTVYSWISRGKKILRETLS